MTQIRCPIVEIKGWRKHPEADTLAVTGVCNECVIFKIGEFDKGSRAVFIPEEAVLPNIPLFEFVWKQRLLEGKPIREIDRVVKARRLRGIFSCGLIIPVPSEFAHLDPATDIASQLGITKYEQPEAVCMGGDNAQQQGWLVKFTDIENVRRYDTVLIPGEEVIITEKIHGSNARYCFHSGRESFFIGSHTNVKRDDHKNVWSVVANKIGMEGKCQLYPDLIFFGETYGTVQKGYDYGLKEAAFVLFDIYNINEHKYLEWDQVIEIAKKLNLTIVPLLYRGPWVDIAHAAQFADGPTVLGLGKHNREGCVIRTVPERWNDNCGRTVLKLIGQEYLLGKYKR